MIAKVVIVMDSQGAGDAIARMHRLVEQDIPFESHYIDQERAEDESALAAYLTSVLTRQKMGTALWVYADWSLLQAIGRLAEEIGFSESEMELSGYGVKPKKIFCACCQHIMNTAAPEPKIVCDSCGQVISVSNHYSRRLGAYLGYATIQVNGQTTVNRQG